MATLKQIFGSNVRQTRKQRGLTVEKLAERVGVSVETIGRVERGETAPSFDSIEQIAAGLEVSPQELFGLVTEAVPGTTRGDILAQLQAITADATDTQLSLIAQLAAVVLNVRTR